MKKVLWVLPFICVALFVLPSCEKKTKGEKFLEKTKEDVEDASEDVEETAKDGADETEKGAKKTKKKLKDLLK